MTITKAKPRTTQQAATADFIAGAPDSGTATKGVKKGNKQQISLTMTPCPACQGGRAGGEDGAVTRRRD